MEAKGGVDVISLTLTKHLLQAKPWTGSYTVAAILAPVPKDTQEFLPAFSKALPSLPQPQSFSVTSLRVI